MLCFQWFCTSKVHTQQCEHAGWWGEKSFPIRGTDHDPKGIKWELMGKCNSLSFMQYRGSMDPIILQAFIIIFNLLSNLGSTHLGWHFSWMSNSFLIRAGVWNSSPGISKMIWLGFSANTLKPLARRSPPFPSYFHNHPLHVFLSSLLPFAMSESWEL